MINKKKYPGFNEDKELILYRTMSNNTLKFINELREPVADIGPINSKSEYLAEKLNINISQVYCRDFNYNRMKGKYKTIFCFEVLEHVQNALFFIRNLKNILDDDGILYLSTPNRFSFMWSSCHYYEMSGDILQKFLCNPLNLVITRKKRIWKGLRLSYKNFIGIRPLLRLPFLLFDNTWIYEIRKEA